WRTATLMFGEVNTPGATSHMQEDKKPRKRSGKAVVTTTVIGIEHLLDLVDHLHDQLVLAKATATGTPHGSLEGLVARALLLALAHDGECNRHRHAVTEQIGDVERERKPRVFVDKAELGNRAGDGDGELGDGQHGGRSMVDGLV